MTSNTIYYSFYAVNPHEIKDSSEGTFDVTLRCELALVALLDRPLLTCQCLEAAFTNTTSSVCRIPSFSVLLKYSFPTLLPPFSKSQQNRRNPPPPSQRPHTSRNLPSFLTRCFSSHFAFSNCVSRIVGIGDRKERHASKVQVHPSIT